MYTANAWPNHRRTAAMRRTQDGGRVTNAGRWQFFSAQETEVAAWEALQAYVTNHNAAMRYEHDQSQCYCCWTLDPESFRLVETNSIIRLSGGCNSGSFIHTSPARVPTLKSELSKYVVEYVVKYCLGCRGWQHMTRDRVGWYRCWGCGYTRNVDGV